MLTESFLLIDYCLIRRFSEIEGAMGFSVSVETKNESLEELDSEMNEIAKVMESRLTKSQDNFRQSALQYQIQGVFPKVLWLLA